jgi:hypothetical protein
MRKLIIGIFAAMLGFGAPVALACENGSCVAFGPGAACDNGEGNCNQITIVPDSELELLGVSVDHKTWEAPDGTIYRCAGGFYAIKVKGQGTIWCNGKEL